MENLLKSGVELDEKKILEETAAQMEIFRLRLEEPEFDDEDCDYDDDDKYDGFTKLSTYSTIMMMVMDMMVTMVP